MRCGDPQSSTRAFGDLLRVSPRRRVVFIENGARLAACRDDREVLESEVGRRRVCSRPGDARPDDPINVKECGKVDSSVTAVSHRLVRNAGRARAPPRTRTRRPLAERRAEDALLARAHEHAEDLRRQSRPSARGPRVRSSGSRGSAGSAARCPLLGLVALVLRERLERAVVWFLWWKRRVSRFSRMPLMNLSSTSGQQRTSSNSSRRLG